MIKVRLKISACFRTVQGAEHFAHSRSYPSTARKPDRNILDSITAATEGTPFLPVPLFDSEIDLTGYLFFALLLSINFTYHHSSDLVNPSPKQAGLLDTFKQL
jgi:hypothetical protein